MTHKDHRKTRQKTNLATQYRKYLDLLSDTESTQTDLTRVEAILTEKNREIGKLFTESALQRVEIDDLRRRAYRCPWCRLLKWWRG